MDCNSILKNIEIEVKIFFSRDYSGHDYWHAYRVRKISKYIAKREGGDRFLIEAGALVHDVLDRKFEILHKKNNKDYFLSIFKKNDLGIDYIDKIFALAENVSYIKNLCADNNLCNYRKTIEEKIVADADRLDAMGAIGIARVFAFGGAFGREIYDPNILSNANITYEEYLNNKSSSVNHFYEKLLKLKKGMMTETGKYLAKDRHDFMEEYLEKFFKEWNIN